MSRHDVDTPHGSRSNALWGSGNRGGGGHRANALWGRGSRPLVTLAVASLAMVLPFAAVAATGDAPGPQRGLNGTYVPKALLVKALANPAAKLPVIVQSKGGSSDAVNKLKGLGTLKKELKLIGAVSADVSGAQLARLAERSGLTITPDAPVRVSATPTSNQLWPYESGFGKVWGQDASGRYNGKFPAIAIVDSGIDASRADFAGRIVASVNLGTLPNNSAGDGRGHGTFVAGVAAGNAPGVAGGSPFAPIVSIDVMDDTGMARTSEVIAACEWILQNKGKYNIRVANFSLHSSMPSNFTVDPLDRAVEKLWFNGVVVVAAAGNYGTGSLVPSGVKYAPANDPFVITVGAVDIVGTAVTRDDFLAPWSSWGRTYDGFRKPDVVAPGRFVVAPVPVTSTLVKERPTQVVAPGYIQLSGTSFAAPMVAGAAAGILSRHPEYTPDQVKGALMLTARPVPLSSSGFAGAGEVTADAAMELLTAPPDPNAALHRFVVSDGSGGARFDGDAWHAASFADASWDAASYADASWDVASWDVASFADASWDVASYADASFADASYADASFADASYEDAAEGDANASGGYAAAHPNT